MKVSVYVPCYNGERYIGIAITSLLTQERKPDEIIVVDDGSTDASAEIAAAYPVRLIRHDKNLGLAAARNTAVKAATGDIVASIDADCFATPDWLKHMVRMLEKNPKLVGIGGQLIEWQYRTLGDQWRLHHLFQNHGAKLQVNPWFLHGANTAFRRAALLKARGYNEQMRTNGEDFDICQRLRKAMPGHHLIYDPRPKVFHYREDNVRSVVRTRFRYLYYPEAIYRPCNTLARLWSRACQMTRVNWQSIVWDLGRKRPDLAWVSLLCLIYSVAKITADYWRQRGKRAAAGPETTESASDSEPDRAPGAKPPAG